MMSPVFVNSFIIVPPSTLGDLKLWTGLLQAFFLSFFSEVRELFQSEEKLLEQSRFLVLCEKNTLVLEVPVKGIQCMFGFNLYY